MKKTVSFNLEEDIIEKIERYKKDNNLSSRSSALERMILLHGNSSLDMDLIKSMLKDLVSDATGEIETKPEIDKKIEVLGNSIKNSFSSMPDDE